MVVIQLAMNQFSPRIVQTFLQDKPSQNAIGLFVATFVQSILSMRTVLVSDEQPSVPGLSVLVTFSMVLVDIVVLMVYIHHIGRSLRVSALVELVGQNTRDLIGKSTDVDRRGHFLGYSVGYRGQQTREQDKLYIALDKGKHWSG